MKKLILFYRIGIFVILSFAVNQNILSQTVPVGYLEPTMGGSSYDYLRFGTSGEYYFGLMYNINSNSFGNGNNAAIFTYNNRNLNIRTGSGDFIVNPLSNEGKLGIGTNNPESKLHLNGDFYLHGTAPSVNGWGQTHFFWKGHSLIMGSKEGRYSHNRIELKPGGSDRGVLYSNIQMFNALDEGVHEQTVNISSNANHDSYINAGDFGIGTNDPKAKLHVNGNILAAEVTVSTAATEVPDYVFKEDYKLTSLSDLEKYIKESQHLPEIPSAKEVEAEGLDLAKMNLLLLKKIEELTLHAIEQEKKFDKQQEQISKLTDLILELHQNQTSHE